MIGLVRCVRFSRSPHQNIPLLSAFRGSLIIFICQAKSMFPCYRLFVNCNYNYHIVLSYTTYRNSWRCMLSKAFQCSKMTIAITTLVKLQSFTMFVGDQEGVGKINRPPQTNQKLNNLMYY